MPCIHVYTNSVRLTFQAIRLARYRRLTDIVQQRSRRWMMLWWVCQAKISLFKTKYMVRVSAAIRKTLEQIS